MRVCKPTVQRCTLSCSRSGDLIIGWGRRAVCPIKSLGAQQSFVHFFCHEMSNEQVARMHICSYFADAAQRAWIAPTVLVASSPWPTVLSGDRNELSMQGASCRPSTCAAEQT